MARAAGFSIFRLIRLIRDELLIIVGTSSSETVLPRLLAKLQAAGASKQVVGMVIPTGYSFNLDGTCIYLTLGALFIVQATGPGHGDRRADRARGADGADLQGRGGHHRRGPGDADRVAAGVRRHVLLGRVDRHRHRARRRHRPHHERGPRADQRIGNTVATLFIANWQNELDRDRLQEVLKHPEIVDREVDRAMIGADDDDEQEDGGRFERGQTPEHVAGY